jgi:hypothetical protein
MAGANSSSEALARSLRGPVLLITLGALFMIDYAGGASLGRTWPVLLIVLGALKLVEHLLSQRTPVGTGPA